MRIIDRYGITKEELEIIENVVKKISTLGFKVPDIIVKFTPDNRSYTGLRAITIHPNSNLKELRFIVTHKIGYYNEPEQEYCKTWEEQDQKSENFADWFATAFELMEEYKNEKS